RYRSLPDISPPISWSNLPAGTQSVVLLLEDANSPPPEPFVYWVVYNIPPEVQGFDERVPPEKKLKKPLGVIQGKNSKRRVGYLHPAPFNRGLHHLHFEVYALDLQFDPESSKTKSD